MSSDEYITAGPAVTFVVMGARSDNPVLPDEMVLCPHDDESRTSRVLVKTTDLEGTHPETVHTAGSMETDEALLRGVVYAGPTNPVIFYMHHLIDITWGVSKRNEEAFYDRIQRSNEEWDAKLSVFTGVLNTFNTGLSARSRKGFQFVSGHIRDKFDGKPVWITREDQWRMDMFILMERLIIPHWLITTGLPLSGSGLMDGNYIYQHLLHGNMFAAVDTEGPFTMNVVGSGYDWGASPCIRASMVGGTHAFLSLTEF